MVKKLGVSLSLWIVIAAVTASLRAEAEEGPVTMSSFGGLKVNDAVAAGWNVRAITAVDREVVVNVSSGGQPLVIVFSLQSGLPGAFDRDGTRIYYQKAPLPQDTINQVGKATVDRVASFAAGQGGLKRYVTSALSSVTSDSDQYVSAEVARQFLDRLEGKWALTVTTFAKGGTTPKMMGKGTAQRQRFLNPLILREDADGAGGHQFMTVGCRPDTGRCWLFLLDNTSSGYTGGYGVFSRGENTLRILNASGEATVVLRVVDQNHNTLQFYEPGVMSRVARTISYERSK